MDPSAADAAPPRPDAPDLLDATPRPAPRRITGAEWRATLGLGAVYALRMAGFALLLPVLSPYLKGLSPGVAGLWLGVTIGVYGLAQAIFQIPLGRLSDVVGRKPVITVGLVFFALGCAVAAHATTLWGVALGRLVQGLGAMSSAVSALLADVTSEDTRPKAMAILGAGMGLAFVVSLVAGPVLVGWIGVPGVFNAVGVAALLAVPLVVWAVPRAPRPRPDAAGLRKVLTDPLLLELDFGVLALHALLTGLFVLAPFVLEATLKLPPPEHWKLYVAVLLAATVPVFPVLRRVQASGRWRRALAFGVLGLLGSLLLLAAGYGRVATLALGLWAFFVAFNFLEGTLPSLIARLAPPGRRGAAMGVYSSSQFLGGMLGAALGGLVLGLPRATGFAALGVLPLCWLGVAGLVTRRLAPTSGTGASS